MIDLIKQSLVNAQECYVAGMDAASTNSAMRRIVAGEPERVTPPAAGEWAVRQCALQREATFQILLAYDATKRYENVTIPGPLANAIEAARKVVK